MTLTQLKYAITVAEAKSMNEAAKTLFISQPSLSSAITAPNSMPPELTAKRLCFWSLERR